MKWTKELGVLLLFCWHMLRSFPPVFEHATKRTLNQAQYYKPVSKSLCHTVLMFIFTQSYQQNKLDI